MRRAAAALGRLLVGVALVAAVLGRFTPSAFAHALPLSYVDLRLSRDGVDMSVEAPAVDLAHDLSRATGDDLLTPAGLEKQKQALAAILVSRLVVTAGGQPLTPVLQTAEPVLDQKTVRFRFRCDQPVPPGDALRIRCLLFPYDPRHKTFVDVYQNGDLKRQLIFTKDAPTQVYARGSRQSTLSVVGQFLFEGVHHIFLGPDHILFVIGLLLLGGTLKQLLKIVSAFTLAHSVTLALATLGLFNPPARLIEPAIAASIVFVGVHSLLSKDTRDLRLVFAFGFGFIHGFGFANALREMELPRTALVWSLLSFNFGVEIGQACIVLSVAPLLALLRARVKPAVARRVLLAGSLGVIGAGAFWFIQRIISPG